MTNDKNQSNIDESRDNLIKSVVSVLSKYPEICFATLFGSANACRLVASSDIDIAIAGQQPLSINQKMALSENLGSVLKREIDIVDLHQVNGLILEQAMTQSTIIKNNDPKLYAGLLQKLWYDQADMMPYVERILKQRTKAWLQSSS